MAKHTRTIQTSTLPTAESSVELLIPLCPVPASRPRVTRWGTYYSKRYTQWCSDASDLLDAAAECYRQPLKVAVLFAVPRSQYSKLVTPVGDGDNFEKATFDLLQSRGHVEDDRLITSASWKKRFVPFSVDGFTVVKIDFETEDIDLHEDYYRCYQT